MYREMAYGNTFGGWALSSYGAFWISIGIIFTPGGFRVAQAYGGASEAYYQALGLYIFVSTCQNRPMEIAATNEIYLSGLVHLHFSCMAHDTPIHSSLQLSLHVCLDCFHLSRSRVLRCEDDERRHNT